MIMEARLLNHIISMHEINRETIDRLFLRASDLMKADTPLDSILQNKKMGVMFFQTSTRTRLNFEAAMFNLGGKVLGFSDVKTTRSGDFFQESLEDAIQVVGHLVDCIVMRHYQSGSAKQASLVSSVPIINGGDGSNEHPTQAIVDLWIMYNYLGYLDGACIGLMGEPTTRVLRSIIIALTKFKIKKILFLLPPNKEFSNEIKQLLSNAKINYEFRTDIIELLEEADAIEIHPIHLPNLASAIHDETNGKNMTTPFSYCVTKEKILRVGRKVAILHPGPRLDELSTDADILPQVLYFKQIREGLYMRMALLESLLLTH